jgi:hypothetical protein
MAPRSVVPRLSFSTDGRMHNEEELTLSRMSSRLSTLAASNKDPSVSTGHNIADSSVISNANPQQRRRLVFTDPVAFRYASGFCLREMPRTNISI